MATRDQGAFEGFDDIPDPAADVLRQPVPEVAPPAEPSLTRADRRRRGLLGLVVAAAWIAVVLMVQGLRKNIGAAEVVIPLVAWVALAAFALIVSLKPRARGLPPALRAVQIVVAAVPALFIAIALLATRHAERFGTTWHESRNCLVWSSIYAAGPLVIMGLLLQRSFLSAPVWRGAAIGAGTGLVASAAVHAHCISIVSAHVVLAHGFPIAILTAMGALFGALRGRV